MCSKNSEIYKDCWNNRFLPQSEITNFLFRLHLQLSSLFCVANQCKCQRAFLSPLVIGLCANQCHFQQPFLNQSKLSDYLRTTALVSDHF